MENINIVVNKSTRMIQNISKRVLGNDGENLQENLVFSFEDEFVDGQARLELTMPDDTNSYITLTKVDETYQIPVKSIMTQEGKINMQLVVTEGTNEESIPVFKSNVFYLKVSKSINAVEEAPEGYAQWIDLANVKLNQMDTLNLDASKSGKVTSIIITRKDGTQKIINVNDGIGLEYLWQGTSLGIKQEGEAEYTFANLKGDKGDPGSVKFYIVQTLPTENIEIDAMYLVPLQAPESQENKFAEYIYVNNQWELLGKIAIHIDLSDYYTKQQVDNLIPTTLSQLTDDTTHRLVSDTEKATWNGKADKTYVDNLVGDISSALDTINGEVI